MLAAAPRRTGELRRAIRVVNQRTLIAQLRELQRDGLVTRTVSTKSRRASSTG
jgi:DNA-binding HxlR family transcriptional regulator